MTLRIEYERSAIEAICREAQAGLTALPRIGLGVGGALVGDRAGSQFNLRQAISLPCSYSSGPSFRLTPEEREQARKTLPPYGVIGWYCSRPRGKVEPDEKDRELFDDLFPGAWKLLLFVQPTLSNGTRSVMYFRNGNGGLTSAGERVFFDLDPLPEAVAEIRAPIIEEPFFKEPTARLEKGEGPIFKEPAALPEKIGPRYEEPPAVPLAVPVFASKYEMEPESTWRSKIGWLLVALLLIAIAAGAWMTRDVWWPRPELTLTSTPVAGSIELHWNPDAVRGIPRGFMSISDGGALKQIPLDMQQMKSGVLLYQPGSNRVIATIHAGDMRARTEYERRAAPEDPPI